MKRVAAAIALTLLAPLFCSSAAAEVGVRLQLDRVEVTLVDSVRMLVSVSGSRSSDATPVLQGLEDFLVTTGGTSSRVEIINGKVSAGIEYTYFIQPRKTGTFKIGPVKIKVSGRTLESNSATLRVKAPSQPSSPDRGPVFIEASISSHEVYVEEQALYSLKLYRRVSVAGLTLNLPDIEHIEFKQLGRPLEYQTTISGAAYQVLEVRYALLASKEGAYVIGPSKMNMTVRRRGRQSLFDDFFKDPFSAFSSGRPLTLAPMPIELKVHALPQEGRPTGFSGLVGNFQMESRLEPISLKAGGSATLTVQVSGKGNVNRIPDMDLPELPFARTYNDQPILETVQDDQGLGGTKTLKWALVPEQAGRFKIPILSLSFFNPETETYQVIRTVGHTLSVLPGESQEIAALNLSPGTATGADSPVKKEIKQIGKDILPIHTTADNLSVPYRKLSTGWLFWPALIGPVSIYLILMGGLNLRKRSPERLAQLRSKNAFKVLTKRCRQDQDGGADLIDAFKKYLNERFSLSIGTLTADDAERLLLAKGVENKTAGKICSLIGRLENAVYAGEDLQHTDAAKDLLGLVKVLEKEIR